MNPANKNKEYLKIISAGGKKIKKEEKQEKNDKYIGDEHEEQSVTPIINAELNNLLLPSYNSISSPTLDNAFKYDIHETLQNIKTLTLEDNDVINICIYRINTLSLKPFLEYLLYKYPDTDENIPYSKPNSFNKLSHLIQIDTTDNLMTFPRLAYISTMSIDDIITEFLKTILEGDIKVKDAIDGYTTYDNEVFIFLDIGKIMKTILFSEDTTQLNSTLPNLVYKKKNDQWWWVTMSEMINYGHVCDFPMHPSIPNMFFHNTELILLKTPKGKHIECPGIGYVGSHYNKLVFKAVFGTTKATIWANLGPFYYFNTYQVAFKFAGWPWLSSQLKDFKKWESLSGFSDKEGKHVRGGIMRCVRFTGKPKVFLNKKTDKEQDLTDLDKKIMEDPNTSELRKKNIKNTLRLRDNAGEWAQEYDSAYVGRLKQLSDWPPASPILVDKGFFQSLPLSWHTIDKKSLGDKWEETSNYNIE
jgi:hypothetical protein